MADYKIPVFYSVYGYVHIEADSIEEAIEKAWDDECPLPDDAEYCEGSWEVDEEIAYEMN